MSDEIKTFEERVGGASRSMPLLNNYADRKTPVIKVVKPIPEEDLQVIEKIYWKMYPDCGRKRGALLRYIKEFKDNHELPRRHERFLQLIKRKS